MGPESEAELGVECRFGSLPVPPEIPLPQNQSEDHLLGSVVERGLLTSQAPEGLPAISQKTHRDNGQG